MILQFTSVCQCYTATLHASLSRADCVMSRITNSKDPSSEDGEGEESVQGVVAQQLLLPASNGLSLVITGNLYNQEKNPQNLFNFILSRKPKCNALKKKKKTDFWGWQMKINPSLPKFVALFNTFISVDWAYLLVNRPCSWIHTFAHVFVQFVHGWLHLSDKLFTALKSRNPLHCRVVAC